MLIHLSHNHLLARIWRWLGPVFVVSVVAAGLVSSQTSAFSQDISTRVRNVMWSSGCNTVISSLGNQEQILQALIAIPDSTKPSQMNLTGSSWDNSKTFVDQIADRIGNLASDCDDQIALIRYGLNPGGDPSETARIQRIVVEQVDPFKSSWISQLCTPERIRGVYLDAAACTRAETALLGQYETACVVASVKSGSTPTISSYADLAKCAGRSDRLATADQRAQCLAQGGTWENDQCVAAQSQEKETCNVSGIGWIVCPLSIFMAKLTDSIYNFVEQLLFFQPNTNMLDTSNPVYKVWDNIRNLANIVFVVALFIVIFSQATSIGISNYGIKKMLPRIFAAAVLVNLSYYVCLFGLDVSNIIGAGIDGIIKSVPLSNGAGTSSDTTGASGAVATLGIAALTTTLLASSIAASGGLFAALAGLMVFLPVILMSVLTALVVLVGRQALIILLIIVSPLAFAAMILPNTDKLFASWRKAFTTMLVFYPLVAVLFSGTQVAASVLRLSANGGGVGDQLIKVMSLGVQTFPLFALPFLLKFSGGVLGKVAGVVNNPNKGPFDKMRKNLEGRRDVTQNLARAKALGSDSPNFNTGRFKRTRRAAYGMFGAGSVKRKAEKDYQQGLAKGISEESSQEYIAKTALDSSSGGDFAKRMARSDNPVYIAAVQASAQATADKIEKQSIANREILYRAKIAPGDLGSMEREFQDAVAGKDATAVKALQNLMISNGSVGMDSLRRATASVVSAGADVSTVSAMKKNLQEVHGQTLKQKSADLLYWATDTDNKDYANYHSKNAGSWEGLSVAELATQSAGSLNAAVSSGAVSAVKANALLRDARVRERLGEKQIEALEAASRMSEDQRAKLKQDFAASTYGPTI